MVLELLQNESLSVKQVLGRLYLRQRKLPALVDPEKNLGKVTMSIVYASAALALLWVLHIGPKLRSHCLDAGSQYC